MAYADLREFIRALEKAGELKRVSDEVDPELEITEIADRAVKAGFYDKAADDKIFYKP